MKVFGLQLRLPTRLKEYAASIGGLTSVSAMSGAFSYMWGLVRESYAGAWQHNVVAVETERNLLAYSPVYACIAMIAGDISKLRMRLMQLKDSGVWVETTSPAFSPVLRKPNPHQTYIQFLSDWVVSLLIHGNTYVYKERDARNVVTALYVLNPTRVKPLVNQSTGDVFYELRSDGLAGVDVPEGQAMVVSADDIVHDRTVCLWHPLVGVPPLFAAAATSTQGIRLQAASAQFSTNMSRPSGHLTTASVLDDKQFEKIKTRVEDATTGRNIGRLLITGGGMKFEPMNMIPPEQAQLIEQLRWTAEDIALAFGIPSYKIVTTQTPSYNNIGALNQDYYSQCLQRRIESIEVLMDEALGLGPTASSVEARALGVELDVDALLRMDPVARATRNKDAITAGWMTPNEARFTESLVPASGGDKLFMQQQMVPIDVLAARTTVDPTPAKPALPAPAPVETPPKPAEPAKVMPSPAAMALALIKAFGEEVAA